jgi:hypothetical protein
MSDELHFQIELNQMFFVLVGALLLQKQFLHMLHGSLLSGNFIFFLLLISSHVIF